MAEQIREALERQFWTEFDEMLDSIRDEGFSILEANDEYVAVEGDDEDEEIILYIGRANRTMWIDSVRTF